MAHFIVNVRCEVTSSATTRPLRYCIQGAVPKEAEYAMIEYIFKRGIHPQEIASVVHSIQDVAELYSIHVEPQAVNPRALPPGVELIGEDTTIIGPK